MDSSWLDIGPASSFLAKQRGLRLAARVKKIREILTHLQWRIDIRQNLITLYESKGRYCKTCTQDLTKRYCSPSCPLQRPVDTPGGYTLPAKDTWVKNAKRDVECFEELSRDVEAHGSEANEQTVEKWECRASGLCSRMQDKSIRAKLMNTRFEGWTQDWTFEDSWGKGPELEHELAPDELD